MAVCERGYGILTLFPPVPVEQSIGWLPSSWVDGNNI